MIRSITSVASDVECRTDIPSLEQKVKQGARFVTYRYRWLEGVPLRDGTDALSLPVQLLAYHTTVFMGTDVDQPRNLAKSVTVE
jgi:hypothetical protein